MGIMGISERSPHVARLPVVRLPVPRLRGAARPPRFARCGIGRQPIGGVGGVPAAASVGRRSVRRWRSVGPSASLAAYVINMSVFVAERNDGNGHPLHIGASPYPSTHRSAAFSRNFLFLFFLFWGTESNP